MRSLFAIAPSLRTLAAVLAFATLASASQPQTAHFVGAETVVAPSGLSNPHQVAVDAAGNIYIADSGNNRVLKETLTAQGYQQSIVVSTGLKNPTGVAVDTTGNVFVADSGNNRILKEHPSAGSFSQVVVPITGLSTPLSIAVDASGNLYITDSGNGRTLKESLIGSNYSQSQLLSVPDPDGIALDSSGNVYVCVPQYNLVYKLTPSGGSYSATQIGDEFIAPHDVAVDALGFVYVAEDGGGIVRLYPNGASYIQSPFLSTGSTQQTISADANGNLYYSDPTDGRLLKLIQTGVNFGSSAIGATTKPESLVFSFDTSGSIGTPAVVTQGVAGKDFTDAGSGSCTTNGPSHLYQSGDTCTVDVVFDPLRPGARVGAVLLANNSGSTLATGFLEGTGTGPQTSFVPSVPVRLSLPDLKNPLAVAADGFGNLYVTESSSTCDPNCSVFKETWNGTQFTQTTIGTGFQYPWSIAIDGAGDVYVGDVSSFSIWKLTPSRNGSYALSFFDSYGSVTGVAADGSGNVYFGRGDGGVKIDFAQGGYVTTTSVARSPIVYANGLTVAPTGDLFITDDYNGTIVKITPAAVQSTIVSGLNSPQKVALDQIGNLYVATGFGPYGQILKESPIGGSYKQSTLVSNIQSSALSVDGSGNIFSASSQGASVYEIDYSDPTILTFAATAVGHTSTDSPKTLTIQNSGNAPLSFPIPQTGNNPSLPSGFTAGNSSTCPDVSSGAPEPGTLAAGASCEYSISFSPESETDTSGWMVLTDDALNSAAPAYAQQSVALAVAGAPLTPTVNWSAPASITYGVALNGLQLDATANVPGTFSYSPSLGAVLGVGSQTLTATFTPADTVAFKNTSATVTLVVTQATPTISWAKPVAITYGTALSSTQLNASTPVAGTFSYSPAAPAILHAGSQTLSVTFTPSDSVDYKETTDSVTLVVNKATPTITWAAPSAITYGTALSSTQLDASSNVSGTFVYSPVAGTVLGIGNHALKATFTPTDSADYTVEVPSVTLTVEQATPAIAWSAPAAITYGTALSSTQLKAAATGVTGKPLPGTFAYTPAAGSIVHAGSQQLSVTFTPTDSTDYAATIATVMLTVFKATPALTWATPAPISYGTALTSTQLDASSTVPGTFAYSPATGTVLGLGTHTLKATFTPTDSADYTAPVSSTTLVVNKAIPAIAWPTPAAITYGTALSSIQLNATVTGVTGKPLPGTLAYTPSAGTILNAGSQKLSLTFTPTDSTDYAATTATVMLTVNKATPAVTWATPAPISYGTALTSTQLDASSTVAGSFTYSPIAGTVLGIGTHTLKATFTPTDTADYAVVIPSVTLTVNQATPTITWPAPAPIASGTPLSSTQLNATVTGVTGKPLPGTLTYNPPAGTVLSAGQQTLTVSFAPTDATDYKPATASVTITVQ